MTIPPELAALQRYIHNSAKMAEVPSCQTLIGVRQFVELDDVARAWPQQARGDAAAWQVRRKWGNPNTAIWVDITKETFDAINALPVDDEETRELYTHPADTSALRELLKKFIQCFTATGDFTGITPNPSDVTLAKKLIGD